MTSPMKWIGEPGPARDDRCGENDEAGRPYLSHEAAVAVSISALDWSPRGNRFGCDRRNREAFGVQLLKR